MKNRIKSKVLIVDDLKDNRLIIKMTLKKSGEYIFLEASDGKEGVDIAKKELPHIILMDAMMPVMDGFEAIKMLRKDENTKKIPILMVSALDRKDDKVRALESGISDFISKPFDKTELIIRVNSLLSLYLEFLYKEEKLIELNTELDMHKHNLEIKVEEEIERRKEKEKMLYQQSRLASMGEMMDAVAHQWKQPLTAISAQTVNLKMRSSLGMEINEEFVGEFCDSLSNQVKHMTTTLNEFRSFFRPSKNQAEFSVKEMIDKVLLLVKDEFLKNSIKIELDSQDNFKLFGIENEFKHLVINVINNAKDAFVEHGIKDRKIVITLRSDDENKYVEIVDNAGGIPENILPDIFKANVTSKEEGKGTGIGLYMSSQIAQKHNGVLSADNIDNGAKFTFRCKKI